MAGSDPQATKGMLDGLLQPWHDAVNDPATAQEEVLQRLLGGYAQTDYGAEHGATQIETLKDYRRAFPVATYEDYKPLIQRVMAGEVKLLLNEEPVGWAITRGTTGDESKFIPMTPTDLRMRISAGRAVMNYIAQSERYDVFEGANLNLNFPSVVGTVQVGDREIEYGYSSGIYTKYVSAFTPVRSAPTQEEIDALGGDKTVSAWEAHFELAYEKCREENVTLVGGVAPTAVRVARYLRPVADADRHAGQRAGHQHPLPAGAARTLWPHRHPRDLRWRDRMYVRPATRREKSLAHAAQL